MSLSCEKDDNQNITNNKISKKIGNYFLLDTIGKGTFSKVSLGYHILTQQTVAIKILRKEDIKDQIDIDRINREVIILKMVNHPNISKLYETLSTSHNFYIVMEYVEGGDLFDYISNEGKLSERQSCLFFRQLISCVEYLSKFGVSHRDIKPENILLNKDKTMIKLIDFGLSNFSEKGEKLSSSCGSPCYASPEMISGRPYYGLGTDIWSCGIVLFCMLVGCLPFDDDDIQSLYKKIIDGEFIVPSTLSSDAIDFLKKILDTNPLKRITIDEIKKHKWFNIVQNKLNPGILIDDVYIDIGIIKEILKKYFADNKEINESTMYEEVKKNECNKYSATYFLYLKLMGIDITKKDKDKGTYKNVKGNYLWNAKKKEKQKDMIGVNVLSNEKKEKMSLLLKGNNDLMQKMSNTKTRNMKGKDSHVRKGTFTSETTLKKNINNSKIENYNKQRNLSLFDISLKSKSKQKTIEDKKKSKSVNQKNDINSKKKTNTPLAFNTHNKISFNSIKKSSIISDKSKDKNANITSVNKLSNSVSLNFISNKSSYTSNYSTFDNLKNSCKSSSFSANKKGNINKLTKRYNKKPKLGSNDINNIFINPILKNDNKIITIYSVHNKIQKQDPRYDKTFITQMVNSKSKEKNHKGESLMYETLHKKKISEGREKILNKEITHKVHLTCNNQVFKPSSNAKSKEKKKKLLLQKLFIPE